MTKKTPHSPVAAALGAALVGTLSAIHPAAASENPFGLRQLDRGYMQVAAAEGAAGSAEDKAMAEGKCGEGKCGSDMAGGDKAMAEGKCGEGKCGSDMAGGDKAMAEGKCGEGKCGANR